MMSILDQLSSQVGDRTEASNRAVAAKCLDEPGLLAEVAAGLAGRDEKQVGDCAEVMTKVAAEDPTLVAPFAAKLVPLLGHEYTRARWEAAHALALIADKVPELIEAHLQDLDRAIFEDPSTIVRDHAVDTLSSYASVGPQQAEAAYPLLLRSVEAWDGKHAHHALPGLAHVAEDHPRHRPEILELAVRLQDHPKGVVRKAARALLRARSG